MKSIIALVAIMALAVSSVSQAQQPKLSETEERLIFFGNSEANFRVNNDDCLEVIPTAWY